MSKLLPIGTKVYLLEESISDRWFTDTPYHFEIVYGVVDQIIVGNFKQYQISTMNRLAQKSNLRFKRTTDLGLAFWLTYDEAVQAAEWASDVYEKTWAKMMKEPLLRPWREE